METASRPQGEDPVVRHARTEALVTAAAFIVALVWTMCYCAKYGYNRSLDELKFVWGLPDWIFWGLVVPWSSCILFSIFFGAFFVKDDHLGDEPPPEEEGF